MCGCRKGNLRPEETVHKLGNVGRDVVISTHYLNSLRRHYETEEGL